MSAVEDVLEPRLRSLVAEQLGVGEEELVAEASLVEDLAADSLDLVELALTLEAELGIAMPEAIFEAVRSYGDLVATIAELTLARRPGSVRSELLAKARVVSPAGAVVLMRAAVLTPYATEEIGEYAARAGRGARLELAVPESTSDAALAALRARFAWLARHGIDVDVRRDVPPGRARPHPRAA